MELSVIADNSRAIDMYEKAGFVEFGRNPRSGAHHLRVVGFFLFLFWWKNGQEYGIVIKS